MYTFIPDSGFVGTAFVNALSNQLVCFGHRAFLSIECQNGIKVIDDEDSSLSICQDINKQENQAILHIGSLQYGQKKDFLIHISYPNGMSEEEAKENFRCSLTYTPYYTRSQSNLGAMTRINNNSNSNNNDNNNSQSYCFDCNWNQSFEAILDMEIQSFRNRLIHFISTGIANGNGSPADSKLANDMKEWLRNHPKSRRGKTSIDMKYDYVNGMLQDLTGQITEVSI